MNFKLVIFLLSTFCIAVSCNSENNGKIIAEVYNKILYQNQLEKALGSSDLSETDSVQRATKFIEAWVDEQILVHKAETSNLIDELEIKGKVEHYKNTLIIHQYQNTKIKELLDTAISMEEIKSYYEIHKKDFQLRDYLVNVLYIKVSEDAPDLNKLSKWYKLKKESDLEEIKKYVSLYATNFYFDENNWIYFDEITKEIPLQDVNKDKFITRKSKTKFSEEGYYYFLNIIDYKLKNAVSPIEFEMENIKQRILNNRIYNLREEINEQLIKSANDKNAIKIY